MESYLEICKMVDAIKGQGELTDNERAFLNAVAEEKNEISLYRDFADEVVYSVPSTGMTYHLYEDIAYTIKYPAPKELTKDVLKKLMDEFFKYSEYGNIAKLAEWMRSPVCQQTEFPFYGELWEWDDLITLDAKYTELCNCFKSEKEHIQQHEQQTNK